MIKKFNAGSRFYMTLLICFLFFNTPSFSQENVITAGFQFKPIFSSKLFNMETQRDESNNVNFAIKPTGGYCMGMIIRKGISNTVSIESGINYVKRNYNLSIADSASERTTSFTIVGYEIPVTGMVFIQLSDYIYMDVSMGLSLDFYPTDIRTRRDYFDHYSARNSWFSPAVLANVGWEYRTEKSGYFYLGASFHRPFEDTYYSFVVYPDSRNPTSQGKMQLKGNYLTADLRYFFHSDPARRKKKIKK